MDSGAALELVRESVGRTRVEDTAELWYRANTIYSMDRGGRTSTDVASQRPWHWLKHGIQQTTPAGRIEFKRDRALYSDGDWWHLFVDGTSYSGQPGDWEEDESDSPLQELVEACVSAEPVSSHTVNGEEWWSLTTRCDFDRASAGDRQIVAPVTAELPETWEPFDLSNMRVDVWLDGAGRIRRRVLFKSSYRTVIELAGFGHAKPIEEI
jgi:hypothetical protein